MISAQAVVSVSSYLSYKQALFGQLESGTRGAVSAAFARDPALPESEFVNRGRELVNRGFLSGATIYRADGREAFRFGETGGPPATSRSRKMTATERKAGAQSYDAVWQPGDLGIPYRIVARLDAGTV